MNTLRQSLIDTAYSLEAIARSEPDELTLGDLALTAAQRGRVVRVDGGIRVFDEASGTGAASTLSVAQPRLVTHRRRLFLRDIVPVLPSTTASTPFVRELNPQGHELAASGVAENGTVVDVSSVADFEPVLITPGMLAASMPVTKQLWDDSPLFVQWVNSELPYLVRVREEYACLRGDGEEINADIVGILNDDDVTDGGALTGLVHAAATLCKTVAGAGVMPDAVFCSAVDYFAMVDGMASGYPPAVLELLPPFAPTESLASGTVIAGAFGEGAVIIDREETTVEVFNQHSDFAAANKLFVRGEERVGFHVVKPWAFAFSTQVTV